MNYKNQKEILACQYLIKRLKLEYGANCPTSDLDDFPELRKNGKSQCGSCLAKQTIEFLENNIELLKDY